MNENFYVSTLMLLVFLAWFHQGFWARLDLSQISIVKFIPRRPPDESNPATLRQYYAMQPGGEGKHRRRRENNHRFSHRRRGTKEGKNEDTCEKCE